MTSNGYMKGIGSIVRQRRKAFGLDQATVAELAGVSRKLVSDLERGKETIQVDKLVAVLNSLGLSLEVTHDR